MFEALCRHTVCTGAALAIYAAQASLQNAGDLAIGVNAQRAKIFQIGQTSVRGPEHGQSRGFQATGRAYKVLKHFCYKLHSHCRSPCSSQQLLSAPRHACNWL